MSPTLESRFGPEGYRECYVAFLDILGFKALLDRSMNDPRVVERLAELTATTAGPGSGRKQTSLGPCLMQTRAFSDCIVVFSPVDARGEEPSHPNPLAQLLFLVRYLHDRVLDLGACLRGGVTKGPMYWHPAWSNPVRHAAAGTRGSLSLAFGLGLAEAYRLESEKAKHPRVAISDGLVQQIRECGVEATPFGLDGDRGRLDAFLRNDGDGVDYLDLLHPRVTRQAGETMTASDGEFTVEWSWQQNVHARVLETCDRLAVEQLSMPIKDCVRSKYEWLRGYVASHRPRQAAGSDAK
jgi:hypothetical protein